MDKKQFKTWIGSRLDLFAKQKELGIDWRGIIGLAGFDLTEENLFVCLDEADKSGFKKELNMKIIELLIKSRKKNPLDNDTYNRIWKSL